MEKKSKIVTLGEINQVFFRLMRARRELVRVEEDLEKMQEAFDNLVNRSSAKVLAEWARTESFTDHI